MQEASAPLLCSECFVRGRECAPPPPSRIGSVFPSQSRLRPRLARISGPKPKTTGAVVNSTSIPVPATPFRLHPGSEALLMLQSILWGCGPDVCLPSRDGQHRKEVIFLNPVGDPGVTWEAEALVGLPREPRKGYGFPKIRKTGSLAVRGTKVELSAAGKLSITLCVQNESGV